MSGSPIRPVDAMNILGIYVEEGNHKRPQEEYGTEQNDSGWNETTDYPYDKEQCDFDIVDSDLDPNVFYRDYFMTGRPVVLRGQASQMELDMFSKHRLSQTKKFHPDMEVRVGPTAYPSITNQQSCEKRMSINELEEGKACEEMPEKPMVRAVHPKKKDFEELYPGFDGNVLDERGGFRSIQQFYSHVEDIFDVGWQVFFGGDGSGATFHWHPAAFNILYVGVKEWKIAPPLYRGHTGMTAQQVAAVLDPKISLTCIQRPGDMFYIPNFWGHSTFNHGFTIGAAGIVGNRYQDGGTSYRGLVYKDEEDKEGTEAGHDEQDGPPFLFVHINKTGGTSLIKMFRKRCEEEYWGSKWLDSNGESHRAFHATAHAYIEKYGREAWDKAYTFTVVRHPLARQVSNFFFHTSIGCDKPYSKCNERLIQVLDLDSMTDNEKIKAFHEWIVKLYDTFPPGSPEHYRFGSDGRGNEVYDTFGASQTSWNADANGNIVVKDFYKLEELSEDMSVLANRIPCLKNGPLDMLKKNETPKYPDFMLFAKAERTKKIINEVFADDFKNFGYDPL
uniref:JmjC domain-containing protein n=1 Tax=Ditylum brightwellii TaxID=49249 RepID=A0A7S4RXA4_9STRA